MMINFKTQKPPQNVKLNVLLGGGHMTAAIYLGGNFLEIFEGKKTIILNIDRDFDEESKRVLSWEVLTKKGE